MSNATFTEGQVVELKSGGPAMTFVGLDEKDEAMCIWFEGKKKHSGTFPVSSLKPHTPATFTQATTSRG